MKRLIHYDRFDQDVLYVSPDVPFSDYEDFLYHKHGNVVVEVQDGYADNHCPKTDCDECIFHYYDNNEGCCEHAFNIFKRLSTRISKTKALHG